MNQKKILNAMLAAILAATPALADGPNFLVDVSISDLAGTPTLTFFDTSANEADWEICVDGPCGAGTPDVSEALNFLWVDGSNKGLPFVIEHNTEDFLLYLDSTERIGIGTSAPGTSLEIEGANPEITLDDTSAGAGEAYFQLNNNQATIEGNSGTDIIGYDVRGPETLYIDFDGRATFFNDVQLNSSRATKTAIEDIDGGDVLARLVGLPISRWSYKTQGDDVRHLGPMAEDFHAAFGLGDTASAISIVDVAGVALAAARELAVRVERLENENRRLDAELSSVRGSLGAEARLAELERRLARLEGTASVTMARKR